MYFFLFIHSLYDFIFIDTALRRAEVFKNNERDILMRGQYWNYNKNKSFKEGQIAIDLIHIKSNDDLWLLFHVGKITKDLHVLNGMRYKYEELEEYRKYFGRLIVRFKNSSQNMVRNAISVIDNCIVEQILPDTFD